MSGEFIVASWPRNSRETIIVKLGEYQGNAVVDVRTWFDGGDGLRPGRSGITLAVKHLPALATAITKAAALATEAIPPPGDGTCDAEMAPHDS